MAGYAKPAVAARAFGLVAAICFSVFSFVTVLAVGEVRAEPIRGAGSTFAAPVIARWARAYSEARADGGDFVSPDWTVDYELVGSLAGLMRLEQPELDFAASDVPVEPEELARRGHQQFPFVLGGIAVVVNLDGVRVGELRLPGPVLADIYLGRVTTWKDPGIAAANPGLGLPDLPITVVYRKDGSGSTFAFTEYLSAVSPEWRERLGADTLIAWPAGKGAEGTQDLIRSVQATKGAIAYAEFGQVARTSMPFASIENASGRFVAPGHEGFQAAIDSVDWSQTRDFYAALTNRTGENAYPITAATFAIVPVARRSAGRYGRVHDFFRLAFDKGGEDARALGYVPLPAPLVERIKQYWVEELRTRS
ncbi:phosphate ABC transporter substrate-binding protein PstS [Pseudochelatococcus lubricantis]|uniref:phosphate ABC transporter substrate-binding protein PstS n=1 Tax=Pseudochelatococcus lubricantis TaxID=1538102 RepID=UPI0035EA56EF